jgi:hypothetical protein
MTTCHDRFNHTIPRIEFLDEAENGTGEVKKTEGKQSFGSGLLVEGGLTNSSVLH